MAESLWILFISICLDYLARLRTLHAKNSFLSPRTSILHLTRTGRISCFYTFLFFQSPSALRLGPTSTSTAHRLKYGIPATFMVIARLTGLQVLVTFRFRLVSRVL